MITTHNPTDMFWYASTKKITELNQYGSKIMYIARKGCKYNIRAISKMKK